jgi:hypothetical protein
VLIGLTGLRPAPVLQPDGTAQFPPNAFDDERRSNMKVSQFSSVKLINDHPRLFVALGTHSIYTSSGTQAVDAYPDDIRPNACIFDTPALAPPDPASPFNSFPIWLAKLYGGGFSPFGVVAGLVAAAWEGMVPAPQGLDPATGHSAPPDQAPSAGQGKTIKPAGLAIPPVDVGPDPSDWTSTQGLIIGPRRYDFLADRASQVWWPGDDGQTGYRGRWGQRVENDPVPRRCGMRFPEFHKMFFMALADGNAKGQLP